MDRDWNDWRVCLAWLLDIYSAPELAQLLGMSERTVYAWGNESKPSTPEHASRRDLINLARRAQGRLKALETLGYMVEVNPAGTVPTPPPMFTQQFDAPAEPEESMDSADDEGIEPSGIPTDPRKRAEINARLREAQRQHGIIREDD